MNEDPIIIIGAGPAGLMAAQQLASKGFEVHIYEKNKAAARKFLVAGHGGFNLTHSEPIDTFVEKYNVNEIQHIVRFFNNNQTIAWLSSIGIQTYIGSSGKIFPEKNIKPIQVLNAWLDHLHQLGVCIHYDHNLVDFDTQFVHLNHQGNIRSKRYYKMILALGGGSWRKTGSDASWIALLESKNIAVTALQSANSGYNTSHDFSLLEGQVLKNIEISFDGIKKMGEMVFTKYGVEGSPLYYLNRYTRPYSFPLRIQVDLKPKTSIDTILHHLQSGGNIGSLLKNKLKLSSTAISLLRKLDKRTFTDPTGLATAIKSYSISITGLRPIDEVISTAGGVSFKALNEDLTLLKHPNIYCAGEMIDWEAPTGGYLLQACFSTGAWVAESISKKEQSTDVI